MKADPDVKMISAEAPILFAKGCDIFITELTMRAWIHAEENKRRTLQRSDIASALARSDMFDFLIDIVPREEAATKRTSGPGGGATPAQGAGSQMMPPQAQQMSQPGQAPGGGQGQQQHHMGGHQEYALASNQIPHEPEYGRAQPGMYAPPVGGDPAYGQHQNQMFEGMYGYPAMNTQPVSHLANPHTKAGEHYCGALSVRHQVLIQPREADSLTAMTTRRCMV